MRLEQKFSWSTYHPIEFGALNSHIPNKQLGDMIPSFIQGGEGTDVSHVLRGQCLLDDVH
jgi:hypothetical protein